MKAFVTVVLGTFFSLGACGGRVDADESRIGADAGPDGPAQRSTCEASGGRCGPTADLPCGERERTLGTSLCDDFAPCCAALPIPPDGTCWDVTGDCEAAAAPPGRPSTLATCEGASRSGAPGTCVCNENSTPLGGRCVPRLEPGETLLCADPGSDFEGVAGLCDEQACAAGSRCLPRCRPDTNCSDPAHFSASCEPIVRSVVRDDPRPFCVVVDCGSIRCDAPLRCLDAQRSLCGP